jgi:hypothetical protein
MNKQTIEFKELSMYATDEIIELRKRNEIRLTEAKQKLGDKWLMHPNNIIKKLKKKRVSKQTV